MARVFSTSFNYKNQFYTALVTIGSDPASPISVYIPDTSLHGVLPEGKMLLDGERKMVINEGRSIEPELKESIITAVKQHEENKPERSVWN